MKAIAQEHPLSCGLACVASAANRAYRQVFKLANQKDAWTRGYYCPDLVSLLKKMKMRYAYAPYSLKTRKYLQKKGTIVFITSKKMPYGHYLLRTPKGWMNSWINFPRITPAKAGFTKKLPGKPKWVIYPV